MNAQYDHIFFNAPIQNVTLGILYLQSQGIQKNFVLIHPHNPLNLLQGLL